MNEENGSAAASATGEKPVPQVWRVVLLVVAAFVLCHELTGYFMMATHTPRGSIGLTTAYFCDDASFCRVETVRPDGPAARLGIRPGDSIRFDRPLDYQRPVAIGEAVGVTLRSGEEPGGALSHRVIRGEARFTPATATRLVSKTSSVVTTLVGVLLVLGGGRRAATIYLGAALIGMACFDTLAAPWASNPYVYMLTVSLLNAIPIAAIVMFIVFARTLRREIGGHDPRVWKWVQWSLLAVSGGLNIYQLWATFAGRTLPGLGGLFELAVALFYVGLGTATLILATGWRESRGGARTRYGFMLVATLLISGAQIFGLWLNLTGNDFTFGNPVFVGYIVSPIVGVLVFAYALLRHRVVDLGFVVNRTLIYGVLSSGILLVFGLAEWAIEKILPLSHETSAIIEAAVALGIFLVFHRIRDVVETVVEKLLFVRWHDNEARLRTFVAEASFIRKPAILTEAFVAELTRFSGGADCRLLVADGGHGFVQTGASEAAVMDGDDPLVVKLRATREVVETDTLLVAPMIHRAELTGFAVLGLKPSGDGYRPDERTVLAWAAHQIGLDLHALEIERLEDEASDLRRTIATQAAQIQIARDLGALRPA
jgi:hypothetical protein